MRDYRPPAPARWDIVKPTAGLPDHAGDVARAALLRQHASIRAGTPIERRDIAIVLGEFADV